MTSIAAVRESGLRLPLRLVSCIHARPTALFLGCILLASAPRLHAQVQTAPNPGDATVAHPGQPQDGFGTTDPAMAKRLEVVRNQDRQKQLVADTQKLFLLAQQLRDEVAKSKSDQLSVDVVKTSAQIEKLAKSVNEKMRGY